MSDAELERLVGRDYQYGFTTDVEQTFIPKGLSEATVKLISAKKEEPEWLLEWRLKAFAAFLQMLEARRSEPTWAKVSVPEDRLPGHVLLRSPRRKKAQAREPGRGRPRASSDLRQARDPARRAEAAVGSQGRRRRRLRQRLGRDHLQGRTRKAGVIFGSFSEAVREHPELVRKYLGSVVPYSDNFYAALNSAVFSDGSFAYIPKGVRAPWSSRPTSGSTPPRPVSSSAR